MISLRGCYINGSGKGLYKLRQSPIGVTHRAKLGSESCDREMTPLRKKIETVRRTSAPRSRNRFNATSGSRAKFHQISTFHFKEASSPFHRHVSLQMCRQRQEFGHGIAFAASLWKCFGKSTYAGILGKHDSRLCKIYCICCILKFIQEKWGIYQEDVFFWGYLQVQFLLYKWITLHHGFMASLWRACYDSCTHCCRPNCSLKYKLT